MRFSLIQGITTGTMMAGAFIFMAWKMALHIIFVGENQLIQLDMEGNRITGELTEKYVAKKGGIDQGLHGNLELVPPDPEYLLVFPSGKIISAITFETIPFAWFLMPSAL